MNNKTKNENARVQVRGLTLIKTVKLIEKHPLKKHKMP